MSNLYKWVESYEKIADKFMDFKEDRSQLLKDLRNIYGDISLKYPFMDGVTPLTDIDPFTVFSTFNRGITDENRTKII